MNHNHTALLTRRRIARHKRNWQRAKVLGDYEGFCKERRADLLAQAELREMEKGEKP